MESLSKRLFERHSKNEALDIQSSVLVFSKKSIFQPSTDGTNAKKGSLETPFFVLKTDRQTLEFFTL